MATIVFDPGQIGTNSDTASDNASDIGDNDTDITSNYTVASDNASDIGDNDTDITSNYTVASDNESDITDNDTDITSNATLASDAADDASDASVAASSAVSDVDVIEADDRYAKSIYSDPASDSFAVKQIDVASDSKIYLSHSDTAV